MSVYRHIIREKNRSQEIGDTVTDDGNIVVLVERSAKDDFEAFGELYNIYLDRIYRYVFYHVKDKMTAEDLTEEIFMKAWKSIGKYRGKGQLFSSWLYRIAHNHVIDSFRTNRQNVSLHMDPPTYGHDPVLEAERYSMQQKIRELISYLPHQQKQVVILKFIEGLDNHEIGAITRKSQGAIRAIQMRALATLRKKLKEQEVGEWILSYQKP